MAPEEVQSCMNFAFEFSNASDINQIAFRDTMRQLESVCRKRKAQRSDAELPFRCSTVVKRRASTPLIQGKEVQNVNSASGDATILGNERNIEKHTGLAGLWLGPRSSSSFNELRKKEYVCCND